MVKFDAEKAELQQELENMDNFDDNIQQDLLVLPYMINLHQVYNDAPLGQKHTIVREVFNDGLTYFKGVFRTPSINPGLQRNSVHLKQIGLLEQPYQFVKSFSPCGDAESMMQHLQELFRIIREIYKNKKRMEDRED